MNTLPELTFRTTAAPIVVLEDDRTTTALIGQVLAAANIANPLEFFAGGRDALGYLGRAADEGRVPALIILDLVVPDLTGLEVLGWIRGRAELSTLPVIMLSGSHEDGDIERAYSLGIDAYLIKPAGIHGLPDVIAGLGLPHLLLARTA